MRVTILLAPLLALIASLQAFGGPIISGGGDSAALRGIGNPDIQCHSPENANQQIRVNVFALDSGLAHLQIARGSGTISFSKVVVNRHLECCAGRPDGCGGDCLEIGSDIFGFSFGQGPLRGSLSIRFPVKKFNGAGKLSDGSNGIHALHCSRSLLH